MTFFRFSTMTVISAGAMVVTVAFFTTAAVVSALAVFTGTFGIIAFTHIRLSFHIPTMGILEYIYPGGVYVKNNLTLGSNIKIFKVENSSQTE